MPSPHGCSYSSVKHAFPTALQGTQPSTDPYEEVSCLLNVYVSRENPRLPPCLRTLPNNVPCLSP